MNLQRCKDQRGTLEDFYSALEPTQGHLPGKGRAMLTLIERLRAQPSERQIYGLTSLDRLCLLASDTYESPWFVIISALDPQNYFIEYLMPDQAAPWPNATVKGEARTIDQALAMTLTAMDLSGGWSCKDGES